MTVSEMIQLARKHVSANPTYESSARLCLADAVHLFDSGDYHGAARRAVASLIYSVGVFHEDCSKAINSQR